MLARLRRLSPSARLAWALWGIALSGAAGLLLAASVAGAAEAPSSVRITVEPPVLSVMAIVISGLALLLSVAAICAAADAKGHQRPGYQPRRIGRP